MIVENKNDEIIIRISAGNKASRIQTILNYLRYEELTSKSRATQKDLNLLLKNAKQGRFKKIKKEIGSDD